jgi:hypothetical protein
MRKIYPITTAVVFLGLAPLVHSERATFYYNATLKFNPDAVVGVSGETAGDFFGEVAGYSGDTGEVTTFGSFSWETSTSLAGSSVRGAAYPYAIVSSELTWAGNTVSADINDSSENAESSEIGYGFGFTGDWCVGGVVCLVRGYPYNPTGNLVFTADNTDFELVDIETGNITVRYSNRDAVYFGQGYTDSRSEFSPKVATTSYADVNVGGVCPYGSSA